MANATGFKTRKNERWIDELFLEGQHISIKDLKVREDIRQEEQVQKYLSKDIMPDYPTPVEFLISEVAHVTNKTSLLKIWDSEGFKGLDVNSFSWWSLKINEAEIRAAEERFLQSSFSDRSKEEAASQQPLSHFTTSPVFINESSRYGNFRFTFPLTELMEVYRKQMCEGEEPVLRVYGTKVFKQEIEYVVLVHSPQNNEKFSQYPLLKPNPLVSYDGNQIIWRAQAICETHNFQLKVNEKKAAIQWMDSHQFYVWDQVSLVFHLNGVLTFPRGTLKANLSSYNLHSKINLSHGENCYSLVEAEKFIKSLPDDDYKKEDEKEEKSGEIKMEMD